MEATASHVLNNEAISPAKRGRSLSNDESIEPPTKKARVEEPENVISDVKQLSERKKELERKLQEVNDSLKKINDKIEKTTNAKNARNLEKEETKKKAAPKKATKAQSKKATSRPKRQVKKSPTAKEAEEPGVGLTPTLESCKNVLAAVARHRFAFPFMEPVDPVRLNIPDYLKVITHPMDFGTVRTKLLSGEYEDASDLDADAQLVFTNACTYNLPGSDVFVMSEALRVYFNKRMKPILEREKKQKLRKEGGIEELKSSVDSIKAELHQLMDKKKPVPSPAAPKPQPIQQKPMTKTELRKLSATINSLTFRHLNTVVMIIKEAQPDLAGEGEQLEIDLHSLDDATLRKLETFVNSLKKKKSRKKEKLSIEAQRELARQSQEGTEKEIEAVQRQIEMLRDPNQPKPQPRAAVTPATTGTPQQNGTAPAEEKVNVDDESNSESESSSDSESSSESVSESESDSDTESEKN